MGIISSLAVTLILIILVSFSWHVKGDKVGIGLQILVSLSSTGLIFYAIKMIMSQVDVEEQGFLDFVYRLIIPYSLSIVCGLLSFIVGSRFQKTDID